MNDDSERTRMGSRGLDRRVGLRAHISVTLGAALALLVATSAWAAFEPYTVGDLNGQNGWDGGVIAGNPVPFTNNNANSNVVSSSDAFSGTQSWRYSGSYGSPGAGTPFTPDVATVGAPNAATAFGPPGDSPVTPAGDTSVVSFAFRAVAPGDGSRFNVYEGSYSREGRTGANLNLETATVGTVRLYFFDLSSTDECTNQDFPSIDIATVAAGSWHTVKMTTTYPNAIPGDLSTYGSTTYVVDEGTPGEVTLSGQSSWVHGFNVCGGTSYAPGGSLKFSNGFNDYPVHQGFYIDDLSMQVIASSTSATVGSFATSFELCTADADCDDANDCTDDACDPGSGCQHSNNSGPCTDGEICTTESCAGGVCVNGAATDCDDDNVCTSDACAMGLGCQYTNVAGTCSDGNPCTTGDTCTTGVCTPAGAVTCDDGNACTTGICDPETGDCTNEVAPATGCLDAGRSSLQFTLGSRAKARWTWLRGAESTCPDFGNPSVDTDYEVCVYDAVGPGSYVLATSFQLPANATWESRGACNWSYRDRSQSIDGIQTFSLRPGTDGRAAIQMSAKGPNMPVPTPVASDQLFAMSPTVTVQLFNGTGTCWQSEFTDASRNTATQFKARQKAVPAP